MAVTKKVSSKNHKGSKATREMINDIAITFMAISPFSLLRIVNSLIEIIIEEM
jgi:hypothetical protein